MALCECGCGIATTIHRGAVRRFRQGHHAKTENHPRWNGGRQRHTEGYIIQYERGGKRNLEHIIIAEKALGHRLPPKAKLHHINGIRSDNRNMNLVICENQAYHLLLHQRQRALDEGCPADWLKCWRCKIYDDPANLRLESTPIHRSCKNEYEKSLRKRRQR